MIENDLCKIRNNYLYSQIIDNNFRLKWNGTLSFGDIIVLIDEDSNEEEFYYLLLIIGFSSTSASSIPSSPL